MTVIALSQVLNRLIEQGHGMARVLFDTEAQTYDYHMASVDRWSYEKEPEPHLSLSENKPHHGRRA